MNKKELPSSYIVFNSDGVAESHCNLEQQLPKTLKQLPVKTSNPNAYLGLTLSEVQASSDEKIVAEYLAKQAEASIEEEKYTELQDAKAEVLSLIDEIKFSEEMGDDVTALKAQLIVAKSKYNKLNNK